MDELEMKSNKFYLNALLTFIFVASAFLVSAPTGLAQDDYDWSEPVNLSLSGASSNPVMVIDSIGTIHVIWLDMISELYKYSYSVDGKVWSQPQFVKFPFGIDDPLPVLIPGPNRSIHVFWTSKGGQLKYAQAPAGNLAYPLNWVLTYSLSKAAGSYDVMVDAQGALHVAYIQVAQNEETPPGVYYVQSPSGGGYWIESRLLYQSEYFRSANQNDLYVRVSASDSRVNQKIYVTWDNRAQKRVFMATSKDSGLTWGNAQELMNVISLDGINTPYNLTVSALGQNVLLIWQAGEPGSSNCTVYSQWSEDGGQNWGDAVAVFGGRSECPSSVRIVSRDIKTTSVMFTGQVNPFMVAWNGTQWSNTQTETQLPPLVNPLTSDVIILGCRFDFIKGDRIYVVGCDQGGGGDIWFTTRVMEPVDNWFSASVVWGEPDVFTVKSKDPERISNFRTVSDRAGNVHAVWVQSPFEEPDLAKTAIEYARWDGMQWTAPETIFTALGGPPLDLVLAADALDRLFLTWIDGFNGDLVFSWANVKRANLSKEWGAITGLPTPSRLINSSDVTMDGSGKIIDVYAIPLNENRGIYIVESSDGGATWSAPVRVFDGVSEGWESIGRPQVSLGADGVLHLIFIRGSVRIGQPVGLYYSRSVDGGSTWSKAQPLSDGEIYWADIVTYDEKAVHVIWQENDGLVLANLSQVSLDGGLSWGKLNNVTGVNERATRVALASDGSEALHFIQVMEKDSKGYINQRGFLLQDWKWDGNTWELDLSSDFVVRGDAADYSVTANITSAGYLGVFIPIEYTGSLSTTQSEVLTFSRYLEGAGDSLLLPISVLPTTDIELNEDAAVEIQPTSTPDLSMLYSDNISTSPLTRNIAGLSLIVLGMIATLFIVFRRPRRQR